MLVREYIPNDFNVVCSINKICHPKPEPDSSLLDKLIMGTTWVVEMDGAVVGFLLSQKRITPYVYNVAVLPEFRGQGVATELFKEFHNFFDSRTSYLYVADNNPAQKLYFDLGYRVTEVRDDFYGPEQNALVMVKRS